MTAWQNAMRSLATEFWEVMRKDKAMNTNFFYRSPIINQVDLVLTTHCNLRCPECAAFIPYLPKREHFDLNYIQNMANFFKGIEILRVVGGEPMIHPQFSEIVPKLRDLFECKKMVLTTNGFHAIENKETLKHFDYLLVSKYDQNHKEVDFITEFFIDKKSIEPTYHVPLSRRAKNPIPCWRHKAGVFVVNGKIFPCCLGLGPDSIGMIPTKSWREEILKVPMPCKTCCFAEEKDSPIGHNWYHEQNPLESIKIEGVSNDLWVTEKAQIKIAKSFHRKFKEITLEIQSLAPRDVFPITISSFMNGVCIDEIVLKNHEITRWDFSLKNVTEGENAQLILKSDKVFRPSEYNTENHDNRLLSFRLLSLMVL